MKYVYDHGKGLACLEYTMRVGDKVVLCLNLRDSQDSIFVTGYVADSPIPVGRTKNQITEFEPIKSKKERDLIAERIRKDLDGLSWKFIDFYPAD